ncbi:MAG: TonB-dependent receptor [Muribaculaceae bacterium]|nr:TonB-dependent receptor [Muribaculaceae bacterium]
MKLRLVILTLLISTLSHLGASEYTPKDSLVVTLDEINITAIKQADKLREEPEASTVLTGGDVEQLGIVTMRGVSDVVPNFYMPDYGSRITSTIYVRGIGARMDQPSVGLNVDNVPFLNKDAYDFDISDISSVVMLRGPQSTLYGRNTIGGVINITTLSPMSYQGWRAFVEVGNGGRVRANAGWYHKFSNKVGLSISGDYSHLDGFFRNEYNGKKIDKENSFNLRAKVIYNPLPELKLQNVASANILRQGGYPYEYVETGRIEYNDTCFYRRFTFTDGITLGYNHEKFDLTSITSVQHIDDNMTLDQDFLPESYFTLTQKKKETSFTEEIIFKGDNGPGWYHWIAGAMTFYKHLDMDAPVVFKDVGIRTLIEDHRNNSNLSYPIKWDTRTFPLNSKFTIPTFGIDVYHESEFKVGKWRFIAGLRFDYEKSILNYQSFCDTGYEIYKKEGEGYIPYRHVDIYVDDRGKLKRDFYSLLPKLAVTYDFSDNGNVYGKVTKGYKSGGFNTQMFSDVLQQRLMNIMGIGSRYDVDDVVGYKPEESWNYEIGSHLYLPEAKLGLELTVFYIDCRDQQLTMFPDGTTTGRIMANAGKTRSFGFEFSGNWHFLKHFDLNLSYGYTNARFREFFNGIYDFSGKYLPYVPSNTFFVQGLYNLDLKKDSRLVFDVNLRGTGPIYWEEDNLLRQNFYALLGASITWEWKNWEFRIWGRNLTDTDYYTFYFKSMNNEFLQRGRGVEAGVSVRWSL